MVPSGSEDPLGLRRAAYGLVRIVNETPLRLNMVEVVDHMIQIVAKQGVAQSLSQTSTEVVEFIIDRLRFYGRDTMGLREDVMEAVTRVRSSTMADLGDILSRMRALQAIVSQPDFETLMIGFKRAHRIVEKEAWNHTEVFPERFQHPSEHRLAQVLDKAQHEVADFVKKQEYGDALHALLTFKAPIDDFFAAVLVNDPDPHIRENRLSLLTAIDRLFLTIADFSCVQSTGADSGS
jgi:glycyl-tRNA synthetase beta chain